MIELTDQNYDDIINNNPDVMVLFSSEQCGPCKTMYPILKDIATSYPALTVATVDVGKYPLTAHRFRIMSVPQTLIYNNGKIMSHMQGSRTKADLLEVLGV